MIVVIDRFEGKYAVCEMKDRTMVDIPIDRLPKGAKTGDVLVIENNIITIDVEETKKRAEDIERLTKNLWT